mmetsp:Transcript_160319/g.389276  ORF Transcript_160319/g.389276 Transcript_160319/m.389276 type:complete len:202 (+) Transcript_160319:477-1082(+)
MCLNNVGQQVVPLEPRSVGPRRVTQQAHASRRARTEHHLPVRVDLGRRGLVQTVPQKEWVQHCRRADFRLSVLPVCELAVNRAQARAIATACHVTAPRLLRGRQASRQPPRTLSGCSLREPAAHRLHRVQHAHLTDGLERVVLFQDEHAVKAIALEGVAARDAVLGLDAAPRLLPRELPHGAKVALPWAGARVDLILQRGH